MRRAAASDYLSLSHRVCPTSRWFSKVCEIGTNPSAGGVPTRVRLPLRGSSEANRYTTRCHWLAGLSSFHPEQCVSLKPAQRGAVEPRQFSEHEGGCGTHLSDSDVARGLPCCPNLQCGRH